MKNEEGRMKNSVGTAGRELIISMSVGLKGWRGGDTTLSCRGYYAKIWALKIIPALHGAGGDYFYLWYTAT